jgi:hypothetical protein
MNANQIWVSHLDAFQSKKFDIFTESKKIEDKDTLVEILLRGEIVPKLFFSVVENTQSITEQMFFNTILKFSSPRMERKSKVLFIQTLNRFGIY